MSKLRHYNVMTNKIIVVFQLLEYHSCDNLKTNNYFNNVSSNLNFKFSLSLALSLVEIGGEALSCQPDRGSNPEFKLTSCRLVKLLVNWFRG